MMALDNVSKVDYNKLMTGFTKLFSTIIYSTIWREDMHIKVVWITMLAMADRNGRIWASLPGLADAARVSIEQCEDAISRLSSPDKYSRTKTDGGRRIREIDGGWEIGNYLKYREKRDDVERRLQTNAAVRRYRQKKSELITVSQGKPLSAQAEADKQIADTTKDKRGASRHVFVKPTIQEVDDYIRSQGYSGFTGQQFIDHYTANGWKVGRNPMKDWQAATRNWNSRSRTTPTREKFGGEAAVKRDDRPCQYCGKPYPCKCYEEAEHE
jgi:hypothetical protein